MKTDEDHATMRESFSLVQTFSSLNTLTYFLLMCMKIWLKNYGNQMQFGFFFYSVLWRELVVSLAKLLVSMTYDNWNISGNYHTKLDNRQSQFWGSERTAFGI